MRYNIATNKFIVLARKFFSTAAEIGYLNAVLYGLNKIFDVLGEFAQIYRYILVSQPIPNYPLLPHRRGQSIDIKLITSMDKALLDLPLTYDVLNFRFEQGAVCFGAFKNGSIIGCLWLCMDRYNEDEIRCRFIPRPTGQVCWDFDVYVVPEHRSGIAFARLWDVANGYLRKRGIRWSMSRISAFNIASLAAHERLGSVRIGGATFIRLLGWQIMMSSLRPFFHLSLGPTMIPDLPLHDGGFIDLEPPGRGIWRRPRTRPADREFGPVPTAAHRHGSYPGGDGVPTVGSGVMAMTNHADNRPPGGVDGTVAMRMAGGLVVLMTLAIVMSSVPIAPIALAAGEAFGHGWVTGTLYVLIGAEAGALVAFTIARLLGHGVLKQWFGERLSAGPLGSQNTIMAIVFAARLMPFVSFHLISYAAGLTYLKAWRFAVATLLGIIPASFLLTHFGDEMATGDGQRITVAALAFGVLTAILAAVRIVWVQYRERTTERH
jgi:uncharacterized membrane protein YdjX (TVP38/TMEM64 family)